MTPHANLIPACLFACLLGAGCDEPRSLGELAFPGSSLSMDALARDALRGLADSDTIQLDQLRLTETEHNEVVWPELPASAPEVGFPVDFAWRNIQLRNYSALGRVGGWYESNPVRHQVTECRGETREFATFRVHTDCWVLFLTIRGELLEAQLFKDVLERDGGFKIFRYYDELPRRARIRRTRHPHPANFGPPGSPSGRA